MNQKNIDTLFQKQLSNLEVSPNKRVWNNIEAKLKKKKRKVFPFWLLSGSIAAVLVLGVFFFPFSKDEIQLEIIKSDEIITKSPKNNTPIINTIDSLTSNKNSEKDILISKKIEDFKDEKKDEKSIKSTKNKELIKIKKPVKSILLSYNSIDRNFSDTKNNFSSKIIERSHQKKMVKKLSLEDYAKKEDKSEIDNLTSKKWSVASVFAVLKSNSFTNTSPINANLASSTKGENSYSYGVQIGYKLNKNWTIQSGIHLQEMSYSNNQIAVFSAVQSNTSSLKFENGNSFSFENNLFESLDASTNSLTNVVSNNGNLVQNFGYIEIPVEIKYSFLNNQKFETQLVTGFSSLFLNKNGLNLITKTATIEGEFTNLNSINFSGNLGFDFNYLFNKNWSFNLNPMLKVQLNTFNTGANGFAPFNLGVYSGIKYQF